MTIQCNFHDITAVMHDYQWFWGYSFFPVRLVSILTMEFNLV